MQLNIPKMSIARMKIFAFPLSTLPTCFSITIAMFSLSQKKRKSQCCFGKNGSACWAETNTSDKIWVKWGHCALPCSAWDFATSPQKHSAKMASASRNSGFLPSTPLSPSLLFPLLFFFSSFFLMLLSEINWKTKKPCVVTWHAYCTGVVGISGARPSRHGCTGN